MTREEFQALEDADVRFQGEDYYCPKDQGESESPLCTREQYQTGSESFAHIFDDGVIRRYGTPIGTIADLTLIEDHHSVSPDLFTGLPRLLNADETWPGFQRRRKEQP